MMYYTEWLAWMKDDYEEREKEFNFTQEQLDKMYEDYLNSCLD